MASTSDPSQLAHRKQQKGPPFKFLVPLIYAPVLPLIRLGLRKNPVLRDRLFTLVLAGGFAHGLYLVDQGGMYTLLYAVNRPIRYREQVKLWSMAQEI